MTRDQERSATAGGILLLAAALALAVFATSATRSHAANSTDSGDGCRVASSCGYHAPALDPFLAPPPPVVAAPSPLPHPVEDHQRQPAEAFVAVLQRPPIPA